jgi:hypothetical protein
LQNTKHRSKRIPAQMMSLSLVETLPASNFGFLGLVGDQGFRTRFFFLPIGASCQWMMARS